jgi:hypothetical protein
MKKRLNFAARFLASYLTVLSSTAGAKVTTISTRTETQGFARFVEMKKEVTLPKAPATDITYLTDIRFAYSVASPAQIEDYAVVQWIHGCMFESEFKSGRKNGTVEKRLSVDRLYFGNMITFKHATWQIDSDSNDPIYSSYSRKGRFALLRWNKDPSSLNAETSTYYMKAKPSHGSVFVSDSPGPAFLESGTGKRDGKAQNASLEFRTCLFRFSDIPSLTTPSGDNIDRSKALWCVSWDQKFSWDFSLGKMTRPSQIDPICL